MLGHCWPYLLHELLTLNTGPFDFRVAYLCDPSMEIPTYWWQLEVRKKNTRALLFVFLLANHVFVFLIANRTFPPYFLRAFLRACSQSTRRAALAYPLWRSTTTRTAHSTCCGLGPRSLSARPARRGWRAPQRPQLGRGKQGLPPPRWFPFAGALDPTQNCA
jgi:hypothetical protein